MNEAQKKTMDTGFTLEILPQRFSICKLRDFSDADLTSEYVFFAKTDEELSLVCPLDKVPENTAMRDDGWRAFRIFGVLDFSLIGILAKISDVLAEAEIGIFAVSTYNTDYILIKDDNFKKALAALADAGYVIK